MRVENPRVSIAIPAFNEADVLPELLERVGSLLDGLPGGPHELVIVDDGSSDDTLAILERASSRDDRILVVALARNFGHQPALTAALDHITGDVAVVMDADLQDAPEVIPIMLQHYREGYDVVYAQRASRPEGTLLRACYFLFYRTLAALAEVQLPLDSGDFALLSRRVVLHLRQMPEHHRYLRGLRTWVGFRQLGLPVSRQPRASGSSKYGLLRLLKLATDGLFAFSTIPLRVASAIGGTAIVACSLFALYAVYAKLVLDQSPKGFTALFVAITFLAGVQLLFLGVIGEYLGRVYEEVKGRPLYVVERLVRSGQASPPRPEAANRSTRARLEPRTAGDAEMTGT
jgi:glycosyltransferase involved in cell wall biosynthesis